MKVYIVMDQGGYNENEVDRVFSTLEKAVAYVIDSKFAGKGGYKAMDQKNKEKHASFFVEEFEVE